MEKTWKQLYDELAELMRETLGYLEEAVGEESPTLNNVDNKFEEIQDDAARLEAEEHQ